MSGAAYEIRAARVGDEAGWRLLWQAYCDFYAISIGHDVTSLLWSRILDPSFPINALVAQAAGPKTLIGMANYVLHPYTWGKEPVCYLEDLYVSTQERGKGVGRALIETLIQTAKLQGWKRVYWHTHELNEPARSLYEKLTPRDPFVRYVVRPA